MKLSTLFLCSTALFVGGACNAQTGKRPANNSARTGTRPVTSVPADCYKYFPVKVGSKFRYLKSSRTVTNPEVTVYELTETYYPAKPRTIHGKSHTSYLKDQRLEFIASDVNSFFRITDINRTDRVYFGCTTDKDGTRSYELQEVLQQNSKITGYYTEITERYYTKYLIPNSVTYEDLPLVEIERLGTGVFNTHYLYSSFRDEDRYWWVNQETRQDRLEYSDENPYEYRQFRYEGELDSMEVQGKLYKKLIVFSDVIYASESKVPDNPTKVAVQQLFYAAGVGLVLRIRIEKSGLGFYHSSIEQGLNKLFSETKNDGSDDLTVWELLPEGMDAKSGLKNQVIIYDEVQIKKIANDFFTNSDYESSSISKEKKFTKPQKTIMVLSGEIDKKLVGFWVQPYPNRIEEKHSYTFYADGTCEYSDYGSFFVNPVKGEWRVKNGILLLSVDKLFKNIQEIPLDISTDSKTGKQSFVMSPGYMPYYRVEENEIPALLQKTKTEWVIKNENEPLVGDILKEFVGTWVVSPLKTETYIFNPDGSGLWITESGKNETRQYKKVVKINWRIKEGVFIRQTICDKTPCPRGNKFIDKVGAIELDSDGGKPFIKIAGYTRFYKQ